MRRSSELSSLEVPIKSKLRQLRVSCRTHPKSWRPQTRDEMSHVGQCAHGFRWGRARRRKAERKAKAHPQGVLGRQGLATDALYHPEGELEDHEQVVVAKAGRDLACHQSGGPWRERKAPAAAAEQRTLRCLVRPRTVSGWFISETIWCRSWTPTSVWALLA